VRLGSGIFVFISALMFIWSVLVPGRTRVASPVVQPAE
jgi:nitric oxide reductase subunit B